MSISYRVPYFPCDFVSFFTCKKRGDSNTFFKVLAENGYFHSAAFPYFRSNWRPDCYFFFTNESRHGWIALRPEERHEFLQAHSFINGDKEFTKCLENLSTSADTYRSFLEKITWGSLDTEALNRFLNNFLVAKEADIEPDPGSDYFKRSDGQIDIVGPVYSESVNRMFHRSARPYMAIRAVNQLQAGLTFEMSPAYQISKIGRAHV